METTQGTFIVCHYYGSPKPQSQVSEVDVDGNVIRAFCDQQQLIRPCYVALGSDGRVFVADNYKYRVLSLNSGLELEGVLVGSERRQKAIVSSRISYVEQTRRLVVAFESTNSIEVYTIP